jgi:germination protein M
MTQATRLFAGVLVAVAIAGCGGTKVVTTTTTAPVPRLTQLKVYFLHHDKVQPISRFVSTAEPTWLGVWKNLAGGPTGETPLGVSTALRLRGGWTLGVTSGGLLSLSTIELPRVFLAQTVFTLTQFAPKRPVVVNGGRYSRADFEDLTPAILVESPLPVQSVARPLRVTGTANTFEATFEYELVDSVGKVIAKHFVTATSGSGTRGTFDFTVEYPAGHSGPGKLVVYESSAKDGSRIHVIEIPLQLAS